jgi:PIN domain
MHAAKVGLPEVIRLEVERHLRQDIRAMRDRISQEHERLLGIFGTLREVVLPRDDEIDALVTSIFSQSSFDLLDVPFSEQAARSSFIRTIEKTPPSHKSQQFKDGVLWDNCKHLAETDDVILITDDRAFYEGDDPKKGLATILKGEACQCPHSFRVLPALSDLLSEIRRPVEISDDVLAEAIVKQIGQHIDQLLANTSFLLRQGWRLHKAFYATEAPTMLFVEFTGTIDCQDTSGEGRTQAVLRVKGNGRYDAASQAFADLQPDELSISYETAGGEREHRRTVFASANAVMGHRSITNVVREQLE